MFRALGGEMGTSFLEGGTDLLTAKRSKRQDFPTPESPMSRSLKR